MARRRSRGGDDEQFEQAKAYRCDGGSMLMGESLIPKFTGQDKTYTAARWIQDVEDNTEIMGWSPVQQLLMARRSLAGTAELWLRTERAFKCWDDLKAGVQKEFPDSIDSKTIHEMMSARKKKSSESCYEYMLVMKELGKRGKMADYVAIKYIIQGIQDLEINKVLLYGVTTYSDLKEKLKLYEEMKRRMSAATVAHTKTENKPRVERARFTYCYSCGEKEHTSADCPHKEKGVKCFRCNEFGHIAPHCKSRSESEQTRRSQGGKSDVASEKTSGGTSCYGVMALGSKINSFRKADNDSDRCDSDVSDRTSKYVNKQFSNSKPFKLVSVLNKNVKALIDTGSDLNMLSEDCWKDLSALECKKSELYITGLGDKKVSCLGRVKLDIVIDKQIFKDVLFYILPQSSIPQYKMIIGNDLLQHCVMVMEQGSVTISPARSRMFESFVCDSVDVVGKEMSVDVRHKVNELVQSHVTNKDDIPEVQQPRRKATKERQKADQQVTKWLDGGMSKENYLEYSSPMKVAKNKEGNLKVCKDYQILSKKKVKDDYRLDAKIVKDLRRTKMFQIFKNGFLHLPFNEKFIECSTFILQTDRQYFKLFIPDIFRNPIRKEVPRLCTNNMIITAGNKAQERLTEVASQIGLQMTGKKQLVQSKEKNVTHAIEVGKIKEAQGQDGRLKVVMQLFKENFHSKDYYSESGMLFIGLQKQLVGPRKLDNKIIEKAQENYHFLRNKLFLFTKQENRRKVREKMIKSLEKNKRTYYKKWKKSTKHKQRVKVAVKKVKMKFKVRKNDRYEVWKLDGSFKSKV